MPPAFRFEPSAHTYVSLDTGEEIVHITDLLKLAGLVNDQFFTAESCVRGQAVHTLVTQYDLGALNVDGCISRYRGWLLGHVCATAILQPTWTHLEEAMVHDRPRFAGRPDRVGMIAGAVSVLEVKSGAPQKAHAIQLALQAVLVAPIVGLPAEGIQRYAEYLKDNAKFRVEQFTDRRDVDTARDILARFCA